MVDRLGRGRGKTNFIVPNLHRPEIDSANEPVRFHHLLSYPFRSIPLHSTPSPPNPPLPKGNVKIERKGRCRRSITSGRARKVRYGNSEPPTLRIQHFLYRARNAGGVAADDEFEAVG